jgi:murein DD-endopeptidase MepM/ murein hydrolase activator NlpD
MGQDVMAACGTPLVAVRGGVVQYRGYQASGAGNYVVIDGRRDRHDYMYAHLRRPARVRQGHRVKTGQRIGVVGDTGDATACHLHFEYWSDDWWNGGQALPSVTRVLKRWDSWS